MATYSEIITAIDTAITAGIDKPVSITSPDGRSITYQSIDELITARKYFAKLAVANNLGRPFTITHLKSGGART